MSQNKTPTAGGYEDELAYNAALFVEADRLETFAYSLIESDSTCAISWARFTEAKALAEVKRTEAQQDLLRSRGQSSNAEPT